MKLNQVTLPSSDIERSVEFFTALGFTQIVDAPHYARFECGSEGPSFSVHFVDRVPDGAGTVVYFETEDVDAEVARLQSLCIYHAGRNRLYPPWRMDGREAPDRS